MKYKALGSTERKMNKDDLKYKRKKHYGHKNAPNYNALVNEKNKFENSQSTPEVRYKSSRLSVETSKASGHDVIPLTVLK